MFYSSHKLCDQIHPDTSTLVLQLVPFVLIPITDIIQCIRISRQKSTSGISPTSILLRFLYCTANLGNAFTIPYTFAATECCRNSGLSIPSCMLNMLVVLHAVVLWGSNTISTIVFLFKHNDQTPRILSFPSGELAVSRPFSLYPPWTPGSGFIATICIIASAGILPISLSYIIPLFAVNESYWGSLEAWSFGLNIITAGLAFLQGIPQIALTGAILFGKRERIHNLSKKDTDLIAARKMEFWFLTINAAKWVLLAAVWTTWFGQRLYENINFYLPVLWVVGAQVYLDYLIVGVEDTLLAWMVWSSKRRDWETESVMSDGGVENGSFMRPTEQTPLLTSGMRWHDEGGQDWTS
ncbi:hypothetical protein TWF788_008101 [Orbilia oligospora]|uniref:Uncharacterized protein n=1 Tax=Orbilia oligospora TaxID=2813651 RepID=A0A7C8UA79_ORBOL|nr:hypothetical protein TWF788_008101 [Orbilia oligospora]